MRFRLLAILSLCTLSLWAAEQDTAMLDTTFLNYYQKTWQNRYSIANSFNGSTVSPLQSKIYFDRQQKTRFLFADAYTPYYIAATDIPVLDMKRPFSQIEYRTGGPSHRKEDEIHFIYTGNVSKQVNLGLQLNYLAPYGEYASQQAKDFCGALWVSYAGEHYFMNLSGMMTTMKIHENGGLADLSQFSKESSILTRDLKVNLSSAVSTYRYFAGHYNHGWNIPLFTIRHTLDVDAAQHVFKEQSVDSAFWRNTYYNNATHDSSSVLNIKNRLEFRFRESSNKLGFGLAAFAYNEVQRYGYQTSDTTTRHDWRSTTYVGGQMARQKGKYFDFNVIGDVALVGYRIGEFKVDGSISGRFPVGGGDTASVSGRAYVKNEQPDYFLQQYTSNHFWWSNDFRKVYRTYFGGEIYIPKRVFDFRGEIGFENLTRPIYFDSLGLPQQAEGNVQVFSARVGFNVHVAHFGLENNLVYQKSSSEVMPLPDFTCYENIYFYARLFKVLDLQIGVDMRYFTKYYAPLYQPATGQFCVQTKTKVGNYPLLGVYLNAKIKTVRFYVQLSHFNYWFSNYQYFSMPNYPMNEAQFKFGISWTFFD